MFPIISANSAAASAGNDEGIFGFGWASGWAVSDITNLVSNAGVIASDVSGVGTARSYLAACEYGEDKGIFGYGRISPPPYAVSMTNLVSNTGVVASDVSGVGSARKEVAACGYGEDKGIFGFGRISPPPYAVSMTNLVSNTGVVASDTAGVGQSRKECGACWYGEDVKDKGIFAFGTLGDVPTHTRVTTTNLVSNAGVIASDGAGAGTARGSVAACEYGQDKAIFGFGWVGSFTNVTNLVSNAGVVASDQAATTGTTRSGLAACSFN